LRKTGGFNYFLFYISFLDFFVLTNFLLNNLLHLKIINYCNFYSRLIDQFN